MNLLTISTGSLLRIFPHYTAATCAPARSARVIAPAHESTEEVRPPTTTTGTADDGGRDTTRRRPSTTTDNEKARQR